MRPRKHAWSSHGRVPSLILRAWAIRASIRTLAPPTTRTARTTREVKIAYPVAAEGKNPRQTKRSGRAVCSTRLGARARPEKCERGLTTFVIRELGTWVEYPAKARFEDFS